MNNKKKIAIANYNKYKSHSIKFMPSVLGSLLYYTALQSLWKKCKPKRKSKSIFNKK